MTRATGAVIRFSWCPVTSQLDFPAAEGEHPDQESDTWFIAGQLTGTTGRSFAFLTIFNKNRPGGTVVADFYTMALFDLDTGDYGTYTDYDMPPANMQPGRPAPSCRWPPDISTSATRAVPATRVVDDVPRRRRRTAALHLPGQPGRLRSGRSAHGLDLAVTPTRAPVPVGATDVQRQDRLLRPARHLLVFPDRDGDDAGRCAGASWTSRSAAAQGMSIGSGFPNMPAAVELAAILVPGRTNGARSTSTTAST